MLPPYFMGAEVISGLGLPQFLRFGPGSATKTVDLTQILGKVCPPTDPQLTPSTSLAMECTRIVALLFLR